MKKKRFLFSLLMAIVMMAMSPQKVWAVAIIEYYGAQGGTYTINAYNIDNVTVGSNAYQETAYTMEGGTVTLTPTPNPGCEFVSFSVWDLDGGNSVSLTQNGNSYTFTLPSAYVKVTVKFNRPYSISSNAFQHGSFTSIKDNAGNDITSALAGTTVWVTTAADEGYHMYDLSATYLDEYWNHDTPIDLNYDPQNHNRASFTMPEANVTLSANTEQHVYASNSWAWADDGSEATVTFPCYNDYCGHSFSLNSTTTPAVTITSSTTATTCTSAGTTIYNASVTYNGTPYNAPEKLVVVPATGHSFTNYTDPHHTFCTACNHTFFRYTASERVTPKTISNLKNASGQGIYVDSQNTWDADTKEGVMEFNEPLAIIGDKAFEQCAFTGNLVIPNSVKSIGNNAFYKCGNLANVAFNSVPLVGSHVFDDCDEEIYYDLILTDDSYVYTGNETNNLPADIWAVYKRTNIKNKWGTLVVPFDVLADQEEYDLYSIIRVEDDELTLKRPEGILPAGTPVLIRMSEAGKDAETGKYNLFLEAFNETLKTSGTLTSENVEGITLKGSYDVKDITEVSGYIISNNAFWNIQNIRDGNNVYNAPFRAYLEGSTANCAKMLSIGWNDDEDITAVETLDALTSDEAQYYDINGRKLNDLQQGINIVKRGNKTYKVIIK